jgi:hypothetical protein
VGRSRATAATPTRDTDDLSSSLVLIAGGVVRAGNTVDCSERFPVGTFARTQNEVALLTGKVSRFSLVYVLKKPILMRSSGSEDPCALVYGFDVFEFTEATTPGAPVAGCAGDFRGNGSRDYVVLLKRTLDGRYIPHVFLTQAVPSTSSSRCTPPITQ